MRLEIVVFVIVFGVCALSAPIEELEYNVMDDWHMVPQLDGTFKYMHTNEINAIQEPRYNALKEIVFILFTREGFGVPEVIKYRNMDSLLLSTFNAAHPTKFLIHGWQNDRTADVIAGVAKAYLEIGNYNLIGVDWSGGSSNILYPISKNRVRANAPIIAGMVDFLVEQGQTMKQISCIGHSLGAHTCGVVGKQLSYGKFRTIIGCDPAGPLFSEKNVAERLTPDDAEYVEVIHSNGGKLGYDQAIGHADFYPNGGSSQPGCGLDLTGSCSHGRSTELFIESIIYSEFLAVNCASYKEVKKGKCTSIGPYLTMGGEPDNHSVGDGFYYMTTNKNTPYAKG